MNLQSPYHALFGRPAYAKFMARPCYIYSKLKMPGPKGIITIDGDTDIAIACEEEGATLATTIQGGQDLEGLISDFCNNIKAKRQA